MRASWLVLFGLLSLGISGAAADVLPLPSVDSVLQRLSTNLLLEAKNDRAFRRRHSFVKSRTEIEKSARGQIQKQTSSVVTNTPKTEALEPKSQSRNPIGLGNGASPVSNPTREPGAKPGKRSGGKRQFQIDAELMSHFRFEITHRELRNGRPALRLTFDPRLDTPERDMKDRFLRRMAGDAWIDESDGVLLTLDVRMSSPLDIAGGLAGSIKSFKFHSERERTSDGLWFAKEMNYQVDYREVFSRKIVENSESIRLIPSPLKPPSPMEPVTPNSSALRKP